MSNLTELLVNNDFLLLQGDGNTQIPQNWTHEGSSINPSDFNQNKLKNGILRRTENEGSINIWQTFSQLEPNTSYVISCENLNLNQNIRIRFRRKQSTKNCKVRWTNIDGVTLSEEVSSFKQINQVGKFTTLSDFNKPDTIEISFTNSYQQLSAISLKPENPVLLQSVCVNDKKLSVVIDYKVTTTAKLHIHVKPSTHSISHKVNIIGTDSFYYTFPNTIDFDITSILVYISPTDDFSWNSQRDKHNLSQTEFNCLYQPESSPTPSLTPTTLHTDTTTQNILESLTETDSSCGFPIYPDLLYNSDFSCHTDVNGKIIPQNWTHEGSSINPSDFNQNKLKNGILRRTENEGSINIWQTFSQLEPNTSYVISCENLNLNQNIRIRFRRKQSTKNCKVRWTNINGVMTNTTSQSTQLISEYATFTTLSDFNKPDTIEIRFVHSYIELGKIQLNVDPRTPTPTPTPTPTSSPTPTPTPTSSPTPTPTPTISSTPSSTSVATPTSTPTYDSTITQTIDDDPSESIIFGMRENATGGISAETPPKWVIEETLCSIRKNPVLKLKDGRYKVFVHKQFSSGNWNGRVDWFALPTNDYLDENDEVGIGCLNPYKNRCVHRVVSVTTNGAFGDITSAYYFGNWRISFTNEQEFDVDGNGIFVYINEERYKLFKWGQNYVVRTINDEPIQNGPSTGKISVDVQETEIQVAGTSELLNNGDFYIVAGLYLQESPSEWITPFDPPYAKYDQEYLRQGKLKLSEGENSFWISQKLELGIYQNKRYNLKIESEFNEPIKVRFKHSDGTNSANVLWKSIDGDLIEESSVAEQSVKESAVIIIEATTSMIDTIEIFIDENTILNSISLQGIVVPNEGDSIILPIQGDGKLHKVTSIKETTFIIDGVFDDLQNKFIAYNDCSGHIVSNYNYSKGWQNYDDYSYWVSDNMSTLTSFPYEQNAPKYYLDYVILNYSRFDDLI